MIILITEIISEYPGIWQPYFVLDNNCHCNEGTQRTHCLKKHHIHLLREWSKFEIKIWRTENFAYLLSFISFSSCTYLLYHLRVSLSKNHSICFHLLNHFRATFYLKLKYLNMPGEIMERNPLTKAATWFLIWVLILNCAIKWMYSIRFDEVTLVPFPPGISSWVTTCPITSWSKLKVRPKSEMSPS